MDKDRHRNARQFAACHRARHRKAGCSPVHRCLDRQGPQRRSFDGRGGRIGRLRGNPDHTIGFGRVKDRYADRFGWGKIRMGRNPQTMPFGPITPAVVDAGQRLATHEAVRQAHPTVRATVGPCRQTARCATPERHIHPVDTGRHNPQQRNIARQRDSSPGSRHQFGSGKRPFASRYADFGWLSCSPSGHSRSTKGIGAHA